MATRQVYLSAGDEPVWEQLAEIALEQGISVSALLMTLIRAFLTQHEEQPGVIIDADPS